MIKRERHVAQNGRRELYTTVSVGNLDSKKPRDNLREGAYY
jgi:hypothetical protein